MLVTALMIVLALSLPLLKTRHGIPVFLVVVVASMSLILLANADSGSGRHNVNDFFSHALFCFPAILCAGRPGIRKSDISVFASACLLFLLVLLSMFLLLW